MRAVAWGVLFLMACEKDPSGPSAREKELELELARTKAAEADTARVRAEADAAKARADAEAATAKAAADSAAAADAAEAAARAREPVRVVEFHDNLGDGTQRSWALQPGRYRLAMTASGDGATIKWAGATCAAAKSQTQSFQTECTVTNVGQLLLENPGMGFGSSITATVTLDKLE